MRYFELEFLNSRILDIKFSISRIPISHFRDSNIPMKISIITLFPEIIAANLNYSILKRAQEKGLVEYNIVDHRKFGIGNHKTVDDRPYGGGAGMILRTDVLVEAIRSTQTGEKDEKVILLDPQGKVYTQQKAEKLASLKHLILVCGHYEGFDERVIDYVDEVISVGDYVLTGGEIPTLTIIDSVTRLIPGVLKDTLATRNESHSIKGNARILEGPQYTRPEVFEGKKVPQILLSGDHKKIEEYKTKQAILKTKKLRPDLLK